MSYTTTNGNPGFEAELLAALQSRLTRRADEMRQHYQEQITKELDRIAREEVAALAINLQRWARVHVDDQKITIELVHTEKK